MKGKSKAEAKAELEKSGMSGAELDSILPHKVTSHSSSSSSSSSSFCGNISIKVCVTLISWCLWVLLHLASLASSVFDVCIFRCLKETDLATQLSSPSWRRTCSAHLSVRHDVVSTIQPPLPRYRHVYMHTLLLVHWLTALVTLLGVVSLNIHDYS